MTAHRPLFFPPTIRQGGAKRKEDFNAMEREVRRVVTGHDETGKAIVLLDGPTPNIFARESTGTLARLMWVTDATPADVSGTADAAARKIGIPPPPGGSVFRLVDFPPAPDLAGTAVDLMARAIGGSETGKTRPPSHPYMHRTRSIDYAIIVSGEIDMLLDDSEVHLRQGDVVVQRGTNHAWVNRGREVCRIAFVLIDANDI